MRPKLRSDDKFRSVAREARGPADLSRLIDLSRFEPDKPNKPNDQINACPSHPPRQSRVSRLGSVLFGFSSGATSNFPSPAMSFVLG
jgi:hypothetical protein